MSLELSEKASKLPMLPGVYIMKDKSSRVLYVGKAKQLKSRVSSYFQSAAAADVKTYTMVSKVVDFDVIVVKTEFEAFVLENSLIKYHMPKYNILLRDDKGYPYMRVDMNDEYPSFLIVSKTANDGALYLGPYGSRGSAREAIQTVSKALKLPTCGKNIAKIKGKDRPCLNYHMDACRAYCQNNRSAAEYRESIETAISIFQGKTTELIGRLTSEMQEASENLEFERAAEIRDRLRIVQMLERKQFVIAGANADTDVVGYYRGIAKTCLTVLHYIDGKLISKDYELFESPIEDDDEAISGIVRLYYERRGVLPKTIYLPMDIPDASLLERFFSEKAGRRVYVSMPKRGDKARMIETANINAREEAERASSFEEKTRKTMQWLQNALKLETAPERIEAYDISNTAGADTVAAMTVFVKGKPLKKDYRRFKIKTVQGQNDYQAMAEVVSRRLARHKGDDAGFSELPDIILIDGGLAHSAVAREELRKAGVSLPVFGMVKDERHRTRVLVTPEGEEIGISANPAVFSLIGTIQEETHRFAIEYHRSLRSKSSYASKLDDIEGVGEKRRNALLKKFGSLKAVKKAAVEELHEVVPLKVAEAVSEYFRKTE